MSRNIRDRRPGKGSSAAETGKTGGYDSPVIVAGIGVGAGGTRSLKRLLAKIPSGLGIAYVLVLHPGPSKKILSIRQLRNLTSLEVIEAADGMPVLADRIHVMPTDKFLNITGGKLTLHKPVQCDGMWMPIDHFLCTLAHDFRRRSCGIVLSGAGSDGTLGLSEIKAFGGRTFAEKPGSAEFPEMPQTAIDAGVADVVLAAAAMAGAIADAAEQAQEEIRRAPANARETNLDLRDILNILRSKIGYDFSGYKPNTLVRRIRRRMALGKFASYADYAEFLQEHPEEVALLQKDLLIGVTEFFRQPQAWEILEDKVVAALVENAQPGSEIRVWVPGCSTGQEAYSMAMVLTEQVKNSGKKVGIQIFATDSDPAALATARSGSYSKNEIGQTVSAERLNRFFERKEGRYQILKQIREQIVFAPQNLTADPPFSRLDLISCRNLLMYLEQPVQQRIIVLFHFALRNGGFLFLGTAETTGDREDLFEPISKKWRIYRRIGIGRPAGIEIPVRPAGQAQPPAGTIPVAATVSRMTLASAAQQMLLDRFAPACVMIDRKLHVLYVHGKVEDFLTFPTGELTTRIVDMAREGLRARLRGAIGKCLETKRPVSVIARVRRGEKSVPVKATVSPLRHPRETDGLLLVTFEDHLLPALKSGRKSARESDVQQLTDELKVTREELQSTIEQLEISNDQLKASNEEVTASNEELQSGNEELETSKEELQSLNEELNTINARLQDKVGELENTNNDVLNLLSSTAIATVFLDKELRVKRFTPASTRLLSLIPSDLGRPVADVLRRFSDETLLDEARRVLAELTPLAREVQAEDGRWYFRRITPYRTQDDRIEGVVLTFVDVSDIKQAEQAVRASEKKYRDLVESANSIIVRWKPDGEISYVNPYGLSFFGYREEEILGRNAMILVPGQDSSGQDLTGLTVAIVEHPEHYVSNENENVLADGRRVWVQWTNKAILDEAGNVREILAIGNDITERKRAEEELRLAHVRVSWLARFPEENPNPVMRVSAKGEVLYCNPAAMELDGWKCEIGRPMPGPILLLVKQAMAEGREVMQDVDLGDRMYSIAVTSFPAEGYANVYGRDITRRKQAEAALGRNEAALRGILNATQESVWLFSPEGIVLMSNDMALQRFEKRAEEVIGRNFVEFVPAELSASRMARLREVAETGQPIEFEDERAGVLFHHSFYPVIDSDGRVTGIASFSRDITERKRAENALRQSEERHRLLAETMLQGVVHQDSEGKIVSMNSAAERILGKTRQDFLGSSSVHEEHDTLREDGSSFPGLEHPSMVSLRTGQPLRDVVMGVFNPRDNAYRWISIDAVPVFQPGKDKPHEVYTVFADITERKRAEEALQTTAQRFYNVLSGMYAAVLLVKDDGLVEFANKAFCDIFGLTESPVSLNGLASQEMIAKIKNGYLQPAQAVARIQEIVRIGEPVKGEEVAMSGGRTCLRDFIPIVVNGVSYGRLWHHLDITERKRAEEALQQSRERLDLALSSSRMATFEWDIVKNVRTWSDGVHSLLGTKPETFTGSAEEFFQIIHPEDRSTVQAALASAVETTGVYETEYRAVWPDDSIHHIAARGTVHRDSAGRPVSMTGVCWDITERKRAEMALRLSEEKFSRAFAMNPAAVVLTSLEDGVFLEVNEAFLTIFGFSRDEAVGHSTLELQLWPTSEDRARRVQELREKGSYRDREQIMRRKSGERFTTLTSADIFTLGDERIILSTWLDITERKRAEVALQEARRRLEVIVDSIADGFYALDREWRFTHANDAALRHMGKTREEILGRPLFDIYPETRNSVFETEYARAMESGEPRHFESPSLLTGRVLEIHAYPGSDNLTVLFRDVTEKNRMVTALRESEEALREVNEHLEQRVRERTMDLQNLTEQLEGSRHELRKLASELVMAEERERKRIAGVLHDDIAQTLAAVRMRLEMLQEIPSDQKDTAMKDAKALLVQSIQETRSLMNDLGNPLLFDMGLKPACEALASRLMERHPVRIHCDIRDTYKHLDPDMKTILYQVVRELLNNVVKHSRAQNANVMIDMENEHFRVKVTDDGLGFNPQTLGAPTVEGGFGLYSIRERLIAVDGSLQIESAPGAGTVVTAILPATLD